MRTLWLPLLTALLLTQTIACGNNDNNVRPPVPANNTPGEDESEDQDESTDEEQDETSQANSLTVSDQTTPLATRVVVESVQAVKDGWIAVYEDDDGSPGALLGTLQVSAGASSDLSVDLQAPLTDGQRVHVALHEDDPANGAFDYTADGDEDPITLGADGSELIRRVTVTLAALVAPQLEVDNQTAQQPNVVVIKSLTAPIDAWVVIYDSPAGTRANIVGTLKVEAGQAQDIQVTLDRDVVGGETLYAVLHGDDPADGNFTYAVTPTEDVPLLDDNNAEVERVFVVEAPGAAPLLELGPLVINETELTLSRVVAPSEAWVVVQDEINGQPGSVLGKAFVSPGENTDVYMFLSARALIEGETLYVTLHEDSPQDGSFSYIPGMTEDLPVVAGGQPVREQISVMIPPMLTPDLRVSPSVGLTPGNKLFVQRADIDTDGWLAVYENNAGSIGARVGLEPISAGFNANVAVTITTPLQDGQFYVVRMHREDPVDGVFTHDADPTQDPIAANNKGVEQRANVQVTTLQDAVFVSSQALTNLSTVVNIDTVGATRDSWLVLTSGAQYLGATFVPGSSSLSNVEIVSNRPLTDSENLTVSLHLDMPADGSYDPGADPVVQDQGDDISMSFVPFVDPSVPAVRMTMSVINGQWRVLNIQPSSYITSLPGQLNTDAPAMSLKQGYRYAFLNNSFPAHPLEFINRGPTPAMDVVQMSQAAGITGPLEGSVDWTENQQTVTWTVPANANMLLSGYRSQSNVAARGNLSTR